MGSDCCSTRLDYKHGKDGVTVHNYEPRGAYQPKTCPHGNQYYLQDDDMKRNGGDAPRHRLP